MDVGIHTDTYIYGKYKKHTLNDVGIPDMIHRMFPSEAILGSLRLWPPAGSDGEVELLTAEASRPA